MLNKKPRIKEMNKKDRELSKLYDDFYEYAHMVAVSYSNIKEDQQINEYVHESLMTLIDKVNEGKYDNRNGKGNFEGWCRTVIKNKMNDSVRKKVVRSNRSPLHYMLDELADDEPLENDTIEDSVMDKFLKVNYDRVKRELNKLSYRYRMCMEYHYIEGHFQ